MGTEDGVRNSHGSERHRACESPSPWLGMCASFDDLPRPHWESERRTFNLDRQMETLMPPVVVRGSRVLPEPKSLKEQPLVRNLPGVSAAIHAGSQLDPRMHAHDNPLISLLLQ